LKDIQKNKNSWDKNFSEINVKHLKNVGYIYILSNPIFPYLKIGMTNIKPTDRCKTLSRQTSIPKPFKLEHWELVDNVDTAERDVHLKLNGIRVAKNKEFFDLPLNDAIGVVNFICLRFKQFKGKRIQRGLVDFVEYEVNQMQEKNLYELRA
jgi:hypothetical protein